MKIVMQELNEPRFTRDLLELEATMLAERYRLESEERDSCVLRDSQSLPACLLQSEVETDASHSSRTFPTDTK